MSTPSSIPCRSTISAAVIAGIFILLLSALTLVVTGGGGGSGSFEFYELLGVDRGADTRTIRKAFKRLAILKHPDKNPDDPQAHAAFVRINRAYEVLKDEELRKKYDEHGEEGLDSNFQAGHSHQYQSWQFYQDNFGIYDDDPEIATLSRADFAAEVLESDELWFINFYSTFCSHCHALAPAWRDFARRMDGVIRVGAVNCAEDPALCQSQHVMGYPSLVAYPSHIFYQGHRDVDSLTEFIVSHITTPVHVVSGPPDSLPSTRLQPWVLEFCQEGDYCLSELERKKTAAMLRNLANMGVVDCSEHADTLCSKKVYGRTTGLAYFPGTHADPHSDGVDLGFADLKDIYADVLSLIPQISRLEAEELKALLMSIGDHDSDRVHTSSLTSQDSLLIFVEHVAEGDETLADYKKLASILSELNNAVRLVDCSLPELGRYCQHMNLKTLPKAVLFRANEVGYDINYSNQPKLTTSDIVKFVRKSLPSSLITLTDESYVEATSGNSDSESRTIWIVDYFAPWCPPCLRLLPELRTLPNEILDGKYELRVGSLDCEAHVELCQAADIRSYPTTVIYLPDGTTHRSVGFHPATEVYELIEEALDPSLMELDADTFKYLVEQRQQGEIFVVDFFAPWCGPCMQMAPEFRKLARAMRQDQTLHFATVDCQAHRTLCQELGVRSYPSIRLFGTSDKVREYPSNWWRDHKSMQRWVSEFLPSLVERIASDFSAQVLGSLEPVVVDFFAPWCGHCAQFAPHFEQAAKILEGKVRLVKVDCERTPYICETAAVRAYPSIRLYVGVENKSERQHPSGIQMRAEPNPQRLVGMIEELLERHPPPQWKQSGRKWDDEL